MTEEFKVECEESIEIQSAVFGRTKSSRCIDFDAQNLSCGQDVTMFFKSICDKRKNCSVFIQPGLFNNSSCDKSLEQYLEVSHTCLTSTGNYFNRRALFLDYDLNWYLQNFIIKQFQNASLSKYLNASALTTSLPRQEEDNQLRFFAVNAVKLFCRMYAVGICLPFEFETVFK